MANKNSFTFGKKEVTNAENLEALNTFKFPAEFTFENLTPRNLCFPEIKGLFMRSVTTPDGSNKVDVVVNSFSNLVNVCNSIWQIAELNKYDEAVKISVKNNNSNTEKTEKVEKTTTKKDKDKEKDKPNDNSNSESLLNSNK